MNPSDEPVSARPEEIESLLERVRRNQLGEQDLRLLERLLRLLLSVVRFLEQKNTCKRQSKYRVDTNQPDVMLPTSGPGGGGAILHWRAIRCCRSVLVGLDTHCLRL